MEYITVWEILLEVLWILVVIYFIKEKYNFKNKKWKH